MIMSNQISTKIVLPHFNSSQLSVKLIAASPAQGTISISVARSQQKLVSVVTNSTQREIVDSEYIIEETLDPEYLLLQPIRAKLRYVPEDNLWLITEDIFGEYGTGKTKKDAEADYLSALKSYYEIVEERATEENRATQVQFRNLQQYLSKTMSG